MFKWNRFRLALVWGVVLTGVLWPRNSFGQVDPWTLEEDASVFGLSGDAYTSDDASGFGLQVDYTAQGIFNFGAAVNRASADKSDLGFDVSVVAVGPFVGVYPIRQTREVPLSLGLGFGYAKAWYSSDLFDALNVDVTGSIWTFGGSVSSSIRTSPTVRIIPNLQISHSSVDLKFEAPGYRPGSVDDGTTAFNFGFGVAFRLPEDQTFYVAPSVGVGEDNTSFSVTIGFAFDVSPQSNRNRPRRESRYDQSPSIRREPVGRHSSQRDYVSQDLVGLMVGGVPAKTTVGAMDLDYDQREAIAQLFQVHPRAIDTFRWGITQVPAGHPHANSTWYTITSNNGTETIRISHNGSILERTSY